MWKLPGSVRSAPGERSWREHLWVAIPAGILIELALLLPFADARPGEFRGVPSSIGALVACVTAALAGPAAGATVAVVGGLVFVGLISDFSVWSEVTIAVWVVAAVATGLGAKRVRRAAAARGALLARLRALIEASPIPIVAYDRRGVVTLWSKAAERVFGWSEEEALGQFLPIVPPAKHEEFRQIREQVIRGGVFAGRELERRRKDGSPIEVSIWNAGVPSAGGRIEEVIALVEDITERRRAEQALRESEEKLRLTLEAADTGYWEWDVAENEVRGTNLVGPQYGLPPGGGPTTYESFLELVHPDDRDVLAAAVTNAVEDGLDYQLEFRCVWPDGSVHWILTQAHVQRGPDGSGMRLLGLSRDVTERRRLEDALRLNESLLRAHSEAAIEGTLVVSPEGTILFYNRRFVEMWPIPADVLETRSDEAALQSVVDKLVDPEEFLERVRYLYAHPEEEAREEIQLKDGRTFDRYAAPVRGEDGRYHGRVWFFRDVTEDRREEHAALFLAEAGEVFSASLAYGETLERVARLAVPGFADFCLVQTLEEDGSLRSAAAAHSDPAKEPLVRQMSTSDLSHPVFDELNRGNSRLFAEIPEALLESIAASPEALERLRRLAPRSGILTPLVARGSVIGALNLGRSESGRRFDERDLALADEFGRRAALAIDNARLYEREHAVAETLQRSLLPKALPVNPAFALAARYVPASDGMEVGGDWYDAWEFPDGRTALVIGDVVGHGVESAAGMGQVRNALRAYALDGYGPAEALERLNRVVETVEQGSMTTLVYVVIDAASSSIRFASAGHPSPLLVSPDGRASYLEGGRSVPLGVLPEARYSEIELGLEPASTLILYTDGLVERRGASIEAGLTELRKAAAEADDDLEALLDRLLRTLVGSEGPADDVALLALRAVAVPASGLELRLPAEPSQLALLRRTLGRFLASVRASEKEAYEITLACGEAAANAIEHAYPPGEARFDVQARRVDGAVEIVVRDQGVWCEQRDRGRGLGLPLMRAFMDSVDVWQTAAGTEVRMRRRLHG